MTATSGLDSAAANSILGGSVGYAAFTAFGGSSAKLRLLSSAPSEAVNGTEISGNSYVAGGISFTPTAFWSAPSYSAGVSSIVNNGASGALTQSNMPSATIVGISVWDTGGTPARWWWASGAPSFSSVTTNSGDTLTFNRGSITINLNI